MKMGRETDETVGLVVLVGACIRPFLCLILRIQLGVIRCTFAKS